MIENKIRNIKALTVVNKSNSKRVVRNLEEKNVDTKGNSAKQDLTSAEDITMGLPEGRESTYHRLYELTSKPKQ